MLCEDDVVLTVRDYLNAMGWTIVSYCLGQKHGDDVVAVRGGIRLLVEAKGAGSGTVTSRRYGQLFNGGQVHDHVAKAVLRALRWVSEGTAHAVIALPDNALHRAEIALVRIALDQLGVTRIWIGEDRSVKVEGPSLPAVREGTP
jgi:hypothetical protein